MGADTGAVGACCKKSGSRAQLMKVSLFFGILKERKVLKGKLRI